MVFIEEALSRDGGIDLGEVARIIQRNMERAKLRVVATASNGNHMVEGYLTEKRWHRIFSLIGLPALRYREL